MNFEEFLISKKIDAALFYKNDAISFNTWKSEFDQMHPKSFEARKLFLINKIRRMYKLQDNSGTQEPSTNAPVKPIIKPIIKR